MRVCHIFAGGVLEGTDFISIGENDLVICADSGLVHAKRLGAAPHIVVGDFDSYMEELPENTEIKRSPPEKDDTDTMLALKTAIERGVELVKIYGAFGGRFDHTLANIQTLKYAAEHGCRAVLEDESNTVMLQECGECRYKNREGYYFSVFSYGEVLEISYMRGVKYPLENAEITNGFPIGVSNEITEAEAVLSIKSGTALVVFSKNSNMIS